MKKVKSMQRYKCDFCKKRGIKRTMLFHEVNCYQNPNRVCSQCNNTGTYEVHYGDDNDTTGMEECQFCKAFSKEKFEEIKKYKESNPSDLLKN